MTSAQRRELDASLNNELDRMIKRVRQGEWLDSDTADRIARAMLAAKERLRQVTS